MTMCGSPAVLARAAERPGCWRCGLCVFERSDSMKPSDRRCLLMRRWLVCLVFSGLITCLLSGGGTATKSLAASSGDDRPAAGCLTRDGPVVRQDPVPRGTFVDIVDPQADTAYDFRDVDVLAYPKHHLLRLDNAPGGVCVTGAKV